MSIKAETAEYPCAAGPGPSGNRRRMWFVRFRDDESGVMVAFSIFLLLIIFMVGGIGVDLMRFEMTRSRLQGTIDRAVLAAADLDQTLSPTAVVNDYFAKAGMSDYLASVMVDEGLNYRTVSATGSVLINTSFMRMREIGIPTLRAPASATAEERKAKVEISMVLDISGSMASNSRIVNMRAAAKEFIDTVIRPESTDMVSVSIVPYSQHVNVGPRIFNQMNMVGGQYATLLDNGGSVNPSVAAQNKNKPHTWSYCVEMPDSTYDIVPVSLTKQYAQMQHFQWNYSGRNDLDDTICPRWDYEQVRAFSQDKTELKDQIDDLQPRAGTQIFMGMKWGAAMLDPAFQPVVTDHISHGWVDSEFAGRPVAYNDPETLKTVILMTDGENSVAARLRDDKYDTLEKRIDWSNYNLWYYLNRYVSSRSRSSYYYEKYTENRGDVLLDRICDAAKNAGIVIWSIGFETTNHGANVMRSCASSPAHFFRVEGVEITGAFRAIARQINQLRLTQ